MIEIVKKENKNVWIIDNNTGELLISLSPDISDLRCVNEQVKISQRNGNAESIDPDNVLSLQIEPNAPAPFFGDCNDLLNILATDYFYCCDVINQNQPIVPMKYGSFHDTSTQNPPSSVNVPIQYNTTDLSFGVEIINDMLLRPNIIKFKSNGVYNIQFSAQLHRTSGGSDAKVYIFLYKNGSPINDTNTSIDFKNNIEYAVASWNFFVEILDYNTDNIQLYWYHDQDIELLTQVSVIAGQPDIPSVILTVNQIAQY